MATLRVRVVYIHCLPSRSSHSLLNPLPKALAQNLLLSAGSQLANTMPLCKLENSAPLRGWITHGCALHVSVAGCGDYFTTAHPLERASSYKAQPAYSVSLAILLLITASGFQAVMTRLKLLVPSQSLFYLHSQQQLPELITPSSF